MPEEDSSIRFYHGQYQLKVSFVIFADFEAILQNVARETNPNRQTSYTREINCHIPSGFCTCSTLMYGEVKDPLKQYRGKDCIEVFCSHIEEEARRLYHMFPEKLMESLTPKQEQEFGRARICHICLNMLWPWDERVCDHCHHTEKYRGAAHQKCNL